MMMHCTNEEVEKSCVMMVAGQDKGHTNVKYEIKC